MNSLSQNSSEKAGSEFHPLSYLGVAGSRRHNRRSVSGSYSRGSSQRLLVRELEDVHNQRTLEGNPLLAVFICRGSAFKRLEALAVQV
jgi:hypothetical protein